MKINVARYVLTVLVAIQCLPADSIAGTQNSLIWSVKSVSGRTSYLFGTIHLPDSAVFRQRDTVLKLLDGARVFYSELNHDSILAQSNPMMMLLPNGQTLRDLYTDEEFALVDSVLKKKLGFAAKMAHRMKPAAIVAMLMKSDMEATANTTIDEFLFDRAKEGGIPRFGVETVAEQLAVLDSMPASMLLEAILEDGSEDDGEDVLDVLVNAYSTEDLQLISQKIDSVTTVESFMVQLNDDRNKVMVERLIPALEQGGAFVAVGAAHLSGELGLIGRLIDAGFIVEAVKGGKRVNWMNYPSPQSKH